MKPVVQSALADLNSSDDRLVQAWLALESEIDRHADTPLCQRRVRQLPLDISVVMGGEWCLENAEAVS